MPPPKSSVWKFFKRNADGKTLKCTLCDAQLTYCGTTSNMRYHITNLHPNQLQDEAQPTVGQFLTRSPIKLSETRSESITNSIATMVVKDYLPLSIVSGEGFQGLVNEVAPTFKIPSRNTIKSRIEKMYDEKKKSLIHYLDEIRSVSITTDT